MFMSCGSRGSKSRLAKAAGAEPFGQLRDEKLHTVVARSTFRSKKMLNHNMPGPLLEVRMWEKCALSCRETHFEVNGENT